MSSPEVMNRQLLEAVWAGSLALVQEALQNGADVKATDFYSRTPLHLACGNGHLDVVQYLLTSHGANLAAARDWRGWTPLHHACFRGHLGIVRLLVDNNRDSIFAKSASNNTPLDFANGQLYRDVTNYLLAIYEETVFAQESLLSIHSVLREATYSNDGNNGFRPFFLKALLPIGALSQIQMLNLLQALVDRSARMLHLVDRENGDVPLHIACATRAPFSVVQFLVEADVATVKIVNRSSGALPIHE